MSTTIIGPRPGKQTMFLASSADIAIYGGARGGGKSWQLLLEPTRHAHNPDFRAVFFRKSIADIMKEGQLWDTSQRIYPKLGARSREMPRLDWTFPSGARFKMAHLERESDVEDHRGAQYAYIGIDELTQFSATQFWFLMSCNRSTSGVRPYVRATCNPDPDSWVKEMILWWLDDEARFPREDRAGVVRHFVRADDGALVWGDTAEELRERVPSRFVDGKGKPLPIESVVMSFTFVPAKLDDNDILVSKDPAYRAKLAGMPLVQRRRELEGDWEIRESAGNVFRGDWFVDVDVVEPGVRVVRYWDLAGSKRRRSDFTAGCKLVDHGDGTWTIADMKNEKLRPLEVEKLLRDTAVDDGVECEVHIEQETGAAGELLVDQYARGPLRGFTVVGHSVRNAGTKTERAKPASAAAEKGYVKVKRASWNRPFRAQAQGFPDTDHDDMVDAFTGSFAAVQEGEFAWASGSMGGAR